MIRQEVTHYLNNMANMASSHSTAAGGSVLAVEAYDKKSYLRDFAERYDLPPEQFVLTPSEDALDRILKRWLCGEGRIRFKDRWLANTFCRQLRRSLGEEKKTLVPAESSEVLSLLSSTEDGEPSRYAVDGLAFSFYKDGVLCFLFGHNM